MRFFVAGDPRTKGSLDVKNSGGDGRKAYLKESVDPDGAWRSAVALAAVEAAGRPRPNVTHYRDLPADVTPAFGRGAPVMVTVTFLIRPPASGGSPAGPVLRGTGDIDKLLRNVLDALQDARVLFDDAQVVRSSVSKRWALREVAETPGAWIEVVQA